MKTTKTYLRSMSTNKFSVTIFTNQFVYISLRFSTLCGKSRLHVKASPDSPDSPDSPKHFFEKYDVFLIENGKISDFKLF